MNLPLMLLDLAGAVARLARGADTGVAEVAVFRLDFGHILWKA
jgi:hypothetical protein